MHCKQEQRQLAIYVGNVQSHPGFALLNCCLAETYCSMCSVEVLAGACQCTELLLQSSLGNISIC